MINVKKMLVGFAVAGGLFVGPFAMAGTAGAEQAPVPLPPAGPAVSTAPAWAPPKPADPIWAQGNPQVWDSGWNHWGVWINGAFVPTF